MYQVVYTSAGNYNNGNAFWIDSFIKNNHRKVQFIAFGVLTALSLYVLTPSIFKKRKDMFSSSKRSDKYTTGLINNRNDCFANSSVQALSSMPRLTLYLNDILKQAQFLRTLLERNNNDTVEVSPENSPAPEDTKDTLLSVADRLQTGSPRPSLQALSSRPALTSFSSTATITTLSNASDEVRSEELEEPNENSSGTRVDEGNVESGFSTASSDEIPEIPMHEGLAQIVYQLQQTVTSEKYISVWPFLHVLELIFEAKISTGQNDAHELTQVILETLEKENAKLRKFVKDQSLNVIIPEFPVKGSLADHLICLGCQGSSKVNVHPFSMYPIPVPQEMAANLTEIIADNQTETIEGYSCLSCKIKAILAQEKYRNYAGDSEEEKKKIATLEKIIPDVFINDDLSDELMTYIRSYKKDDCDTSTMKSRIVKKTVVVDSPPLLILHLSRSVFNGMNYTRNSCNVTFQEEMQIQEQKIQNNRCVGVKPVKYRLKAMVKHQGSHSQGHYECYRHKPDFVKDAITGQIINRSPIIDFGMDSNRMAAFAWNQSANNSSDVSSISSNESESSTSSPFRTVFPESSGNQPSSTALVDEDDYVIGSTDSGSSNAPSRKPSKLKKIAGFLSRRSSAASAVSDSGSADSIQPGKRSRMNSIASFHMNRGNSYDDSVVSSSGADLTETSASEVDDSTSGVKRKLKKIKSVLKYPYWKISDAEVKEAKEGEVLGETRFVYLLYYERVDD